MTLSDVIKKNPTVVSVLCLAVIVGAIIAIVSQMTAGSKSAGLTHIYFYDLSTGEVFTEQRTAIPPIRDGNGVWAAVYSCSACDDVASHFVGWIETYTPQAKQVAAALLEEGAVATAEMTMAIDNGHLIAAKPELGSKPNWMPLSSPQAAGVMQSINDRCPSTGEIRSPLTTCAPVQP